jgi:hypothetical protein
VPSEDGIGVITEASFERIHFALVNVIQAQFVNVVSSVRVGSPHGAQAERDRDARKEK